MQCEYLLAIYHNTYYNRTTTLTLKALPMITYCQYRLVLFACMHMIKNTSIHYVNMSQSYNIILTLAPLKTKNCTICE